MVAKFFVIFFLVIIFLTGCGQPKPASTIAPKVSQQTVGVLSATSTPYSDLDPTSSNSHAQNPQVLPMSDDGGDVDIVNGEVSEQIFGAIPERLLIPSINLDSSVVELGWSQSQSDDGRIFSQWDVADHAAGWHLNSAKLGVGGNVVLSGHNNIYGAVFRELDQLKQGDEALLWANGDTYRYTIDKVLIVPETYATEEQRKGNAAWIGHFDDDRLTLVSCWPRDDNSHRIVVVAFAEESDASDSLSEGPTNRN